jgi:hypothetical protein
MRDDAGKARVIAGEANGNGWTRLATAVGPNATRVRVETFGYSGVVLVSHQGGTFGYDVTTYSLQSNGFQYVDSVIRDGSPVEFDTTRPFDPANGKQFLVVALRTPSGDLELDPFEITDGDIHTKFSLMGGGADIIRASLGPPGHIVVAFRNSDRKLQVNLYSLELCNYTAGAYSQEDYCLQRVTDSIASGYPVGRVYDIALATLGDDNNHTWDTNVATLVLTDTWPKLILWRVTNATVSRLVDSGASLFPNSTGVFELGVAGHVEKLLTTVSYTGLGNIGPMSLVTGWRYDP